MVCRWPSDVPDWRMLTYRAKPCNFLLSAND